MRIISPSMLSADFGNLERDTLMIEQSDAEWIHIDVMDGSFVPNISFGFPVLKAIRRYSKKPLDVHLMIVEPERYIKRFADAGADIITFHIEACKDPIEAIRLAKEAGVKVGLSLKPATPIESIVEFLECVDLILVMSVEPGFGGQRFIEGSLDKISKLREEISRCTNKPIIEVDGGVSSNNALEIFTAGADALVLGSALFSKEDPQGEITKILNL